MTWTCTGCTTVYAVGAPCCPHCGSTEYEETHRMAKITRLGGPSNRDAEPPADPPGEAVQPDPAPAPDLEPEPKPTPRRRTRTQAHKEE